MKLLNRENISAVFYGLSGFSSFILLFTLSIALSMPGKLKSYLLVPVIFFFLALVPYVLGMLVDRGSRKIMALSQIIMWSSGFCFFCFLAAISIAYSPQVLPPEADSVFKSLLFWPGFLISTGTFLVGVFLYRSNSSLHHASPIHRGE